MFSGLNTYKAEDKVSCSRTQHSAFGEAESSDPVSSTLPLRHLDNLYFVIIISWFGKIKTEVKVAVSFVHFLVVLLSV